MTTEINSLKKKVEFLELKVSILENQLMRAFELVSRDPGDPESTIVKSRVILEKLIKDIYAKISLDIPKKAKTLGGMLNNNQFTKNLPPRIVLRMNSVREYGNIGAHDEGPVTISDAIDCLKCLVEIIDWYCEKYHIGDVSQIQVDESQNATFFQKNLTKILVGIACLILVVALVAITISQKAQKKIESIDQTSSSDSDIASRQFDKLLAKGLNRDIHKTLNIAYSTKLQETAPSSAITIMLKPGKQSAESWYPLQDGETLSSIDNYKIMFCPETSVYFYVFQIDSRGKLDWLFPANDTTAFSVGKNPVSANVWTQVPGENTAFHLDENLGVEHLYIIATRTPWLEIETSLRKAGSSTSGTAPVQTAFKLKTRGAGGTRYVKPVPKKTDTSSTKEIRRIITGTEGILVYEKWFRHVAP